MVPVYIAGILIVMGWMIAASFTGDIDNKTLLSLIDPFGLYAFEKLTEYWSAHEQNTQYVTLSGYYLYNRLLWGGLGLVCFLWSLFTFKESQSVSTGLVSKEAFDMDMSSKDLPTLSVAPDFSFSSKVNMFFKQLQFELGKS